MMFEVTTNMEVPLAPLPQVQTIVSAALDDLSNDQHTQWVSFFSLRLVRLSPLFYLGHCAGMC